MYAWIWGHLPGGTTSKTPLLLLLVLVVGSLLPFVVFPWLDPRALRLGDRRPLTANRRALLADDQRVGGLDVPVIGLGSD